MTKRPTTINETDCPEPLLLDPEEVQVLRAVVAYALREEELHLRQGRRPKRTFYRNIRALRDALRRQPDEDSISITWHIDDVLSVRERLTEAQARTVLQAVLSHHDASYGVNWNTLEIVADDLFPEDLSSGNEEGAP